MTETLLLNEDLERVYRQALGGDRGVSAHVTGLRAVALFALRGGSLTEWDHCKACGGKILGTKYGEGRSYDGPGVPHVCKPREGRAVRHICDSECECDGSVVTREELDAVKRDVQALARVAMMHRADAPFSAAQRQDACDIVRRIAEGR